MQKFVFVLVFVCLKFTGLCTNITFQLQHGDNNTGILLANYNTSLQPEYYSGTVCNEKFTDTSGEAVCRHMGFNNLQNVSRVPVNLRLTKSTIVLVNVECSAPDFNRNCSYITGVAHNCDHTKDVYLSCTCNNISAFNLDRTECVQCPNSALSSPDRVQCSCPKGRVWNEMHCEECRANFYKPNNVTIAQCVACQQNAVSLGGASKCTCLAGHYLNGTVCEQCAEGYVSVPKRNKCTKCPESTPPLHGKSVCNCLAGMLWNTTTGTCSSCSRNHYSTTGSTRCTRCPRYTISDPGSAHCDACTGGEYWSHHACLPCPAGFSGNGVSCSKCRDVTSDGHCFDNGEHKTNWLAICLGLATGLLLIALIVVLMTNHKSQIINKLRRWFDHNVNVRISYHTVIEDCDTTAGSSGAASALDHMEIDEELEDGDGCQQAASTSAIGSSGSCENIYGAI